MNDLRVKAVIRLAVWLITNVNMVLVASGMNPIPFDANAFAEACTYIVGFGMGLWVWWKDAPMTKEAIRSHVDMLSEKVFNKLMKEAQEELSNGKGDDNE